jgi:murein DD-endopeptidase MepM/ murein hydrolase activator NlpD
MQVILITPSGHNVLTLRLRGWRLWLAIVLLGLILLATARAGIALSTSEGSLVDRFVNWWEVTRDDAMARELGGLKAKIDLLESTVSAMDGEADLNPKQTTPTGKVRPPQVKDLEMRVQKISFAIDDITAFRQKLVERMVGGAAAKPIDAEISSPFGIRSDPFDGSRTLHRGIDFLAPTGTPVFAVGDGVVRLIGPETGYGNVVEIQHSSQLVSRYAHLDGIEVTTGMPLRAGQRIARVGSTGRATGSHLHFELILDGKAVNPKPYLAPLNRQATTAGSETQRLARSL